MNQEETNKRLKIELAFMYNKYHELSEAYKRLANEKGSHEGMSKHDMGHMLFKDEVNDEKNN
jgi:hypothetical protein